MRLIKRSCQYFTACEAQPRIVTGKTSTFVHATIPTISLGASVVDGVAVPLDEKRPSIGEGCLFVIDEIPDLFIEAECSAQRILETSCMTNFSSAPSIVRGEGFIEADDAMTRLLFLNMLCNRLQERMKLEANKRGLTCATTLSGSDVTAVVRALAESLVDDPDFEGLYDLFQVGMVFDPYTFFGKRPCIPKQRQWTVWGSDEDRRTVEHVKGMVHNSVIKLCRAVAAILSDDVRAGTKLVATLDGEITLKVLEPRELHIPKSTGTAVLSAGIPLFSRLYRALHPNDEIRVVDIRLTQQSLTFRALLLTQAFTAKSVTRAFENHSYSGIGEREERSETQKAGSKRARASFLGSLRRAMSEAASIVRRKQANGVLPMGPQRTLLVCHRSAVDWLVGDEGTTWLLNNAPPELSIAPGDPFSFEPEEWGSIVYWGGRGRGENLWKGHRVCITLGDPLPNIGDIEARWGDVVDPQTGSFFEPSQVAVWYAQESVMQALERTRPGRVGLPTVLLHAGMYLPVGFDLDGAEPAEVILAEDTRGEARRAATGMKVAAALAAEKEGQGGALSRGSAVRIARAAGVDPTTARNYMGDDGLDGLEVLLEGAADTGICHFSNLKGEIPVSAHLCDLIEGLLKGEMLKGATLPSSSTLVGILEDCEYPYIRSARTLQVYTKELRERLESGRSLTREGRRNARQSWSAVLVASIEFLGLRQRFQRGVERLLEECGVGGQEESS